MTPILTDVSQATVGRREGTAAFTGVAAVPASEAGRRCRRHSAGVAFVVVHAVVAGGAAEAAAVVG